MNVRSLLFPLTAVIALSAGPALAQHDHSMHMAPSGAATGIAEGTLKGGVRVVEMKVTDDGFVPSKVKVKKGEKVRFVVTRTTDSTCAKEIVIKEAGISQPLPLEKPVTVEFVAKRSGEIRYACGMDHISGVVFVP
ncbi:MAG TPA: cupredoxin domain-containing protein [Longimicrobium sp.]|nr:cupredoxin domain-containing protein [Longimicrobium sp.]